MNYGLTTVEAARIEGIHKGWMKARQQKKYALADRFRSYLEKAGCLGADYKMWHPVFEAPLYRSRRLKAREG